MQASADTPGASYLAQLTDSDLALLAGVEPSLRGRPQAAERLRGEPQLVEALLSRRSSFEAVFADLASAEPLAFVSPFLLFALCVHRCAGELAEASYVTEWFGPRQRTPVFDVAELRDFLDGPARRLFLVELLASYTHVSSGSVLVRTPRGLRRHRFSELDPIRLAGLLDVVPAHDRAGVYRRLGDLALFLTGVFPDHTALAGMSEIDRARLLRAGRARAGRDGELGLGSGGIVTLLERLGPRWYRFADEADPGLALKGEAPIGELARRFGTARRILNVVSDSFLFPFRSRFFGIGG